MAKDYRTMVKKLLALASSPNENEAKAALLKARELMAEHKLGEAECMDADKAVVKRGLSGITCTKRKDSWIGMLAAIIAENYCCTSYRSHRSGEQRNEFGFIGLEEDYDICVMVFRYAVESVREREQEMRREFRGILRSEFITKTCDAYGFGFVSGIKEMYAEQTRQNAEWGLVLTVPKEVEEAGSDMKSGGVFAKESRAKSMYEVQAEIEGRRDGKRFDPEKKLEMA